MATRTTTKQTEAEAEAEPSTTILPVFTNHDAATRARMFPTLAKAEADADLALYSPSAAALANRAGDDWGLTEMVTALGDLRMSESERGSRNVYSTASEYDSAGTWLHEVVKAYGEDGGPIAADANVADIRWTAVRKALAAAYKADGGKALPDTIGGRATASYDRVWNCYRTGALHLFHVWRAACRVPEIVNTNPSAFMADNVGSLITFAIAVHDGRVDASGRFLAEAKGSNRSDTGGQRVTKADDGTEIAYKVATGATEADRRKAEQAARKAHSDAKVAAAKAREAKAKADAEAIVSEVATIVADETKAEVTEVVPGVLISTIVALSADDMRTLAAYCLALADVERAVKASGTTEAEAVTAEAEAVTAEAEAVTV